MAKTRLLPIPMGVGPSPSEFYTKTEIDAMLLEYAKLVTTDLVNYYTKEQTLTTAEIQALVGQITSFEVVATLPVSDIKTNVIYLLGPIGSGADKYEEYIYSNNTWVKIGETSIDLSNYVTITQLNTALGFYTTTVQLNTLLAGKQDTLTAGDGITIGTDNVISADSNVISMTQAEYDQITPDPDKIYIITDAQAVTLSTVATTGAYSDLTGTPTIPTVGTGVVTLTQGGATIGTFGLNDSTDKTIDIPAGSDGKPYIEINSMSQQSLASLYSEIIQDPIDYIKANAVYCYGRPVNYCIDGFYTYDENGILVEDDTLQYETVLFQLETTANMYGDNITYTNYVLLHRDGTSEDVQTMVEGGTAVEGTNDGTNWTSITIGTETYDIPQGGGSTEEIEEAIAAAINDTRDTINQDLHNNYVRTQTMNDQLKNYAPKASLGNYYSKSDIDVQIGSVYAEIEDKERTVSFAINDLNEAMGNTVALVFTLDNLSTVTYNVVIN